MVAWFAFEQDKGEIISNLEKQLWQKGHYSCEIPGRRGSVVIKRLSIMIVQFVFAFACSIAFAFFLTFFFKRRGPGPYHGILYFFAIIFSFTLALGVWMHPLGPIYKGVPWLAVIGTALLITLLIAELIPHKDKAQYVKTKKEIIEEEKMDEEVLKKEFSILMFIIFALLICGYVYALIKGFPLN